MTSGQTEREPPPPGRGLAVVISGPSGAGKTSVSHALLAKEPDAVWSVSATTRPPRSGERDGIEYFFLTREEFQRRVGVGEFLEHAEYQGNLYGTPEASVRELVAAGKIVLIEIEVQGAKQVAERMPESVRIFILPPSPEELEKRLVSRATESREQQKGRLARALEEIEIARNSPTYQYFATNDTIDCCVNEIREIIAKERTRS